MSKKGRVLVAMSGGIDSTVAAMMMHEQGYEVVGITMKTWDYANSGGSKKETGCCSLDSINDARQVAVDMDFPHFIVDIREEFGEVPIRISAQSYLQKFYGKFGFECVSEEYLEDDIPHVEMLLK